MWRKETSIRKREQVNSPVIGEDTLFQDIPAHERVESLGEEQHARHCGHVWNSESNFPRCAGDKYSNVVSIRINWGSASAWRKNWRPSSRLQLQGLEDHGVNARTARSCINQCSYVLHRRNRLARSRKRLMTCGAYANHHEIGNAS